MNGTLAWTTWLDRHDLRAAVAFVLTLLAAAVGFLLAEPAHAAVSKGANLDQVELQSGATDPSVPVAPLLSHLVAAPNQRGVMDGLELPAPTLLKPRVLLREQLQVFNPDWNTLAVFVVGVDDTSLQWLQVNRPALLELGAIGLVDGIPNEAAFKTLQSLAEGLALAPLTGSWFLQRLRLVGADLVPLLILADGTAVQRMPQVAPAITDATTVDSTAEHTTATQPSLTTVGPPGHAGAQP